MTATLDNAAWLDAPMLQIDPLAELERLEDLRALGLLDTPSEARFDRITRLAADYFHVPAAYVAFIDRDRQWIKSHAGPCSVETARKLSFCQYTIQRDEPLIIPDTLQHPVGRNHPFVVGPPHVRFYAGAPIVGPRGKKIGTFCLVDTATRTFSGEDVAALLEFTALVQREINLGEIIQVQNELLHTRQALVEAQKKLELEFSDAAKYVRSMLPPPLDGDVIIDWQFHPSTHLGGDGLGYRRIDEDRIAFYVLDVTGHGLGSALLAVTALELLRNRNPASQINFARPSMVLDRLNRTFQMKDHSGKFFSAWYGVYSKSARTITYSNAGHPPPLLLTHQGGGTELSRTDACASVLGVTTAIAIPEITIPFEPSSELLLFTDGLYELLGEKSGRGSYDEFVGHLQGEIKTSAWDAMLAWLKHAHHHSLIDDDVTMLRFATRA